VIKTIPYLFKTNIFHLANSSCGIGNLGYEGEDIDEGSADSPPIFLLSMTKDHLRADRFEIIIVFRTLNILAFNSSCFMPLMP